MKLGAYLIPSHPPERSVADGRCWDSQELIWLDRLGFEEAWIGETRAGSWVSCSTTDLLIAQSLFETDRLRLGPLGHLLPYHNPVELAYRVAYLDHVSNGRFQLGIGIRSAPTDHAPIDPDTSGGRNRRMSFEVLDLMVRLWAQETQDLDADFWSLGPPHDQLPWLGHDILPLQKPYPPIAIAGLAPGSRNHKLAGEKGYLPISSSIDPDGSITALHWDAVVEGAERSGLSPDRGTWRIIRDIYVAPTDAEARDLAINGTMGRCWREFLLPDYLGLGPILKRDPSLPDAAIDAEYLADNIWLVGSPETVADRVIELYRRTGGFGYLLAAAYDALDEAETWERSLRLLAQEVGPACNQWIATSQNTVLSEAVR